MAGDVELVVARHTAFPPDDNPYRVPARISSRIANEVSDVNRVVFGTTSKPPGTIEREKGVK